ncbi:MAG TPA: hypothetical protein VGB52_15395 [Actinomycetota bacterium]
MARRTRIAPALAVVSIVLLAMAAPAGASRYGTAGFPQYPSFPYEQRFGSGGPAPFIQDQDDSNKWVWQIDPLVYGATGTITFYNYQNAINPAENDPGMAGPGGASVNDWIITSPVTGETGFDPDRPSFTQDVDSIPPDFLTPDAPMQIASDYDLTAYHPDDLQPPTIFTPYENASMDGQANLFKFAFTVAPGTQFMNMQIDKAGNYYVARRDMQWEWIDSFEYHNTETGETRSIDTQFNIQPYPVSDAYGWCGAIPPADPNARQAMAGQLIKDIAFDVWANDGGPHQALKPFASEVVPSFIMRSYGIYEVDVTMLSTGVRQQFRGAAKSVHQRPVDVVIDGDLYPAGSRVEPGDPDFERWFNRVSPFAAGVVPFGAWVINEGSDYMQVVPAGTPGAVWHQNKFAGAAFLVRGDMERRINYINAGSEWAHDQVTTVGPPQVYKDLVDGAAMNPRTGDLWKRADWTDWAVGGLDPVEDGY